MKCCQSPQCQGIEEVFDEVYAADDLKRYAKKGPTRETQMLIDAAVAEGVSGASVLDIGGGIGIIQHELAAQGAERIISVDASTAFLGVSEREAEKHGYTGEYHAGNFVELAGDLPEVDFVTLDRVICCYDDMPGLVAASAGLARKMYALVFPVERWYLKLGRAVYNGAQRLRKDPFRVFTHDTEAVDAVVAEAGLRPAKVWRGLVWQVRIYQPIRT
jgi:magnesium-protoporphyrin O-methyltransferase